MIFLLLAKAAVTSVEQQCQRSKSPPGRMVRGAFEIKVITRLALGIFVYSQRNVSYSLGAGCAQ
jgi:hypothetical protein